MKDLSHMVEDVEINLNDVYSVEPKLSEYAVNYYKSRGVDELLKLIQKEVRNVSSEVWSAEGDLIYIIASGCHRLRALYELGVYNVTIEGDKKPTEITSMEFEKREEIKLKSVPVLNKKDYKEWFEKEIGEPLPKWDPVTLD